MKNGSHHHHKFPISIQRHWLTNSNIVNRQTIYNQIVHGVTAHVQQQRKNDTCNDNNNDKIATLACPVGLPTQVFKVPD
jgi:hypothetical protein